MRRLSWRRARGQPRKRPLFRLTLSLTSSFMSSVWKAMSMRLRQNAPLVPPQMHTTAQRQLKPYPILTSRGEHNSTVTSLGHSKQEVSLHNIELGDVFFRFSRLVAPPFSPYDVHEEVQHYDVDVVV